MGGGEVLPESRDRINSLSVEDDPAAARQLAVIDGQPGAVWVQGGVLRKAFVFAIRDGMIAGIDLVMDPESMGGLSVDILFE